MARLQAPRFRPLQERQVTEEDFQAVWYPLAFANDLAAGNVDAAWQQLSDAAENLLAEPNAQGRSRAQPWVPGPAADQPRRTREVQQRRLKHLRAHPSCKQQ